MQTWSSDGVRQERTAWRCKDISDRHRKWGYNCPVVDLDFVVAEYNHGKPVAIIEYKNENAQEPDIGHPTYQALANLANNYNEGPLPCFIAVYSTQSWTFWVIPINKAAKDYYQDKASTWMSEQDFVRSLYFMRKSTLTASDEAAIAKLNDVGGKA